MAMTCQLPIKFFHPRLEILVEAPPKRMPNLHLATSSNSVAKVSSYLAKSLTYCLSVMEFYSDSWFFVSPGMEL